MSIVPLQIVTVIILPAVIVLAMIYLPFFITRHGHRTDSVIVPEYRRLGDIFLIIFFEAGLAAGVAAAPAYLIDFPTSPLSLPPPVRLGFTIVYFASVGVALLSGAILVIILLRSTRRRRQA